MRGLKDLIREGEKILHYGADELVEHAISDGVNTKMAELSAYVAGQAESFAAMMKAEVEVQRNWIMEHLEVIAIRETSNGLEATFGRKD